MSNEFTKKNVVGVADNLLTHFMDAGVLPLSAEVKISVGSVRGRRSWKCEVIVNGETLDMPSIDMNGAYSTKEAYYRIAPALRYADFMNKIH